MDMVLYKRRGLEPVGSRVEFVKDYHWQVTSGYTCVGRTFPHLTEFGLEL